MAKRMELYSVLKPPVSSCSASTRSNGGRLASARPAMKKITKGTTPVTTQVPLPGLLLGDDAAGGELAGDQEHHGHREAERRLVGHHLRRGAHGAEQRVLGARGPPGEQHAVDGDGAHGEDEQHPDGRVGQLHVGVVAEHGDGAAVACGEVATDGDHGEGEERRDQGQVGRQLEHPAVGPVGQRGLP